MVFVSGSRFVNRGPGAERDVIVYTNCDEVTLVVNGADVATKKAVDHMIVFEGVVVDGENVITAYAGDVKANEIKLNGVAEHDYSYDLPEGNQGANWFDDPAALAARQAFKYPKGYYSIKDKVGVLLANPETAAVLGDVFAKVMGGAGSMMGEGMEMGESMKEFMNMMRLSDMLKMMGAGIPAEVKLALNEALTKIKK